MNRATTKLQPHQPAILVRYWAYACISACDEGLILKLEVRPSSPQVAAGATKSTGFRPTVSAPPAARRAQHGRLARGSGCLPVSPDPRLSAETHCAAVSRLIASVSISSTCEPSGGCISAHRNAVFNLPLPCACFGLLASSSYGHIGQLFSHPSDLPQSRSLTSLLHDSADPLN